jgi:hypothetical protein
LIYQQIDAVLGNSYSGKITGMLLDEKVVDIANLLKDQQYLNQKVFEAYQLINITNQQNPNQQMAGGQNQ